MVNIPMKDVSFNEKNLHLNSSDLNILILDDNSVEGRYYDYGNQSPSDSLIAEFRSLLQNELARQDGPLAGSGVIYEYFDHF